jgi:hypothetical protein
LKNILKEEEEKWGAQQQFIRMEWKFFLFFSFFSFPLSLHEEVAVGTMSDYIRSTSV